MAKEPLEIEWVKDLSEGLKLASTIVKKSAGKALMEGGDFVMVLSVDRAPHGEGTLIGTANVKKISNEEVHVGYNTPYAARLHEHPEYNFRKDKNPKAQGKFLSTPIDENSDSIFQTIAEILMEALS